MPLCSAGASLDPHLGRFRFTTPTHFNAHWGHYYCQRVANVVYSARRCIVDGGSMGVVPILAQPPTRHKLVGGGGCFSNRFQNFPPFFFLQLRTTPRFASVKKNSY